MRAPTHLLELLSEDHRAMVHRLVEDIAGFAILIDVESNGRFRTLLEPLSITTYVNDNIFPLGTSDFSRRSASMSPRSTSCQRGGRRAPSPNKDTV